MEIKRMERAFAIEVAGADSLIDATEYVKKNVTIDNRMAFIGHLISRDGIVLIYAERFEPEKIGPRKDRRDYPLSDLPLFRPLLVSDKKKEMMWT